VRIANLCVSPTTDTHAAGVGVEVNGFSVTLSNHISHASRHTNFIFFKVQGESEREKNNVIDFNKWEKRSRLNNKCLPSSNFLHFPLSDLFFAKKKERIYLFEEEDERAHKNWSMMNCKEREREREENTMWNTFRQQLHMYVRFL
jgi:hypothetical protein